MIEKSNIISERFLNSGVNILQTASKLNINQVGRNIANQLMRSGTSAGANYEEEGLVKIVAKSVITAKKRK